ncbi:MAG: hypothetical protein AB8G86_26825 [Saprospiraceae bacterium]
MSKFCGADDIITPLTKEDDKVRLALGFLGAQNYEKPKSEWSIKERWQYFQKKETPKRKFYNHIPCREIVNLIPEKIWNSYFKFTVERNPFDKAVSFYYWRKANEKYKSITNWLLDGGLKNMQSYDLYSIGKFPVVDKIYRYEDFPFFEKDLTERLNLPEPFQMIEYKAKSKSRKTRDYKQVLDEQAIELIKIAFGREIELLDYKL